MNKLLFYTPLILLMTACSGEEEMPIEEAYAIRNIGELSTTEYTVGKTIKLVDSKTDLDEIEWKEWTEIPEYGDRKILISCRAKVKAGIDLTQIEEGDIKVSGKTIEIKLPPAEITSFSMDSKSVHTEMEQKTGTRSKFSQTDKTNFLKQGEIAIREELNESGILTDANDNAETFLKDFYKQMGYEKVIVKRTVEKQ